MIAQTLILALLDNGVVGPDSILDALEAVVQAQRSTGTETGPEIESAIRTVIAAAEEIALPES